MRYGRWPEDPFTAWGISDAKTCENIPVVLQVEEPSLSFCSPPLLLLLSSTYTLRQLLLLFVECLLYHYADPSSRAFHGVATLPLFTFSGLKWMLRTMHKEKVTTISWWTDADALNIFQGHHSRLLVATTFSFRRLCAHQNLPASWTLASRMYTFAVDFSGAHYKNH